MKIVAFNGSPRGTDSNTDRILQPFLEGARGADAETETVYLKGKQINYCVGCFTCWTKTPGVCIHKDDMPELLEKIRAANLLVYASPLYIYTVTAQMKTLLDRMIPLSSPYIVKRGDQFIHPKRFENEWPKKMVLISNCGFPERHHFSAMEKMFRVFTSGPDTELAAAILCAGGELLRQPPMQEHLKWYIDAARSAGREVVERGSITPETQEILDRPLSEPEIYSQMANAYWDSVVVIDAAAEPAAEITGPGTPLPPPSTLDTMPGMLAGMAMIFNSDAAGAQSADSEEALKAVIQFKVTGKEPGEYYLNIADRKCTAFEGVHPDPTVTITTPSEVWLAVSKGELHGTEAFIKKKYTVDGDMGLLFRFDELFPSGDGPPTPPPHPLTPTEENTVQRGPLKLGMHWLTLAFIPWIFHWFTVDVPDLSAGVTIGIPLLLGALLWGYRRAHGFPVWMETGAPVYFAIAGVATLLGTNFFVANGQIVSNLAMCGIWAGSLGTQVPLTAQYSKWKVPSALWTTPGFIRTNAVLTAFWAAVFLLMAATALVGEYDLAHRSVWIIGRNVLLVPAFAFTAWFQDWYPIRLAKAGF